MCKVKFLSEVLLPEVCFPYVCGDDPVDQWMDKLMIYEYLKAFRGNCKKRKTFSWPSFQVYYYYTLYKDLSVKHCNNEDSYLLVCSTH